MQAEWQMKTLIRLLLQEQSYLGPHGMCRPVGPGIASSGAILSRSTQHVQACLSEYCFFRSNLIWLHKAYPSCLSGYCFFRSNLIWVHTACAGLSVHVLLLQEQSHLGPHGISILSVRVLLLQEQSYLGPHGMSRPVCPGTASSGAILSGSTRQVQACLSGRATENRFFAGPDRFLVCKTDSVCIKRIFFFGPKKHTLRIIYWPNYLD